MLPNLYYFNLYIHTKLLNTLSESKNIMLKPLNIQNTIHTLSQGCMGLLLVYMTQFAVFSFKFQIKESVGGYATTYNHKARDTPLN